MSYHVFVVLHLIKKFQGDRSIYGIYHLLRGKKSSQTIQDSVLFSAQAFFNSLENLSRENWSHLIRSCCSKHLLQEIKKDHFTLTDKGSDTYLMLSKSYSIPAGLELTDWIDIETPFWKKLKMIIQSLSHMVHHKRYYYPVTRQDDIQQWTKNFYRYLKVNRYQISKQLQKEIKTALSTCSDLESGILVYQLSGFQVNGMTIEQLAMLTHSSLFETSFLFKSSVRQLLNQIASKPNKYPILAKIADLDRSASAVSLTQSARKTLKLINRGLTLDQIASIRRLTQNTIEDHVIEIAFQDPSFPIDSFIDENSYQHIQRIIGSLTTKRLSVIKDACGQDISYFMIRLVLAKERI
ncbi:helix-turn-helix domain-containing protein [Terrilactibacillus laevilacticus]|uniref:Helix-turn-helix domain-containing protein n=1 Tax=Terrilactibacillus laevilacticus TaxID=1380157 RepID=A0ABW5PS20_9BACI|nr:helix-turn-helix domain-containing protein [Terrilactibacillus laevilacticus]